MTVYSRGIFRVIVSVYVQENADLAVFMRYKNIITITHSAFPRVSYLG